MIRKYNIFLEELRITRDCSIEEAFRSFTKTIMMCQNELSDKSNFSESYSKTAKSNIYDPEEDFKLVDEFMSSYGFDQKTVRQISEEYGKEKFNSKLNRMNPSNSAPIDYYLYKMTDESFELQGYNWDEFLSDEYRSISGDKNTNEVIIRFEYGWHETKYGRLCIEQNMGSVENFLVDVSSQIPFYLYQILTNSRSGVFKEFDCSEWLSEFTTMDRSIYFEVDNLYSLFNKFLKIPITQIEFFEIIKSKLNHLKSLGLNINITNINDEVRISY
jgi:hypothetical protein